MSVKNLDRHNRWRNKAVSFRVSPQEDEQIEMAVKLAGMTKQECRSISRKNCEKRSEKWYT